MTSATAIVPPLPARYWRSRPGLLVLFCLAFFAALYLYPLAKLFVWSLYGPALGLANYERLFTQASPFIAFRNTLDIAVIVTLVCLALGYPIAFLMTTVGPRARAAISLAVLVPFWTSILVRTYAWIVILGKNGVLNQALTEWGIVARPLSLLYNMFGVQVGLSHVLLPFMVFPLYGVMARIDMRLVRAARSLGASPARAFLHVFLPLSLPGIAAGCVLVFVLGVGAYVTPALLGGEGEVTLATLIELMIRDLLDWGFGATLGVMLLTVVGTLFVAFSAALGLDRLTGRG